MYHARNNSSSPYISAEFKLGSSDKKKMGICWSGNAQEKFYFESFYFLFECRKL